MTTEEILEGNRLIAKFMGFVNTTPTDPDFNIYMNTDGVMRELMSMRYHSDWNWIMECVEQITSVELWDEFDSVNHANTVLAQYLLMVNIQSVFRECVDFIKWYNSRNNG